MTATATILKINFRHLFPNFWSIWVETCSVATGQLLDRNELKSCRSEIQDGHHSCHFENLFWTSCKSQGKLSWILQCSNGLDYTCRWKIAKSLGSWKSKIDAIATILKISFWLFHPNRWVIWVETHFSNRMTSRSKIAILWKELPLRAMNSHTKTKIAEVSKIYNIWLK